MATSAARLYKKDFYAWTRDQAAALRRLADERWNGPLDLLHLAEEVEESVRYALASADPDPGTALDDLFAQTRAAWSVA